MFYHCSIIDRFYDMERKNQVTSTGYRSKKQIKQVTVFQSCVLDLDTCFLKEPRLEQF